MTGLTRRRRWSVAVLLPVLAACHSVTPFLDRQRSDAPSVYTVVLPAGRPESPTLDQHRALLEGRDLDVRVLRFDDTLPVPQRLAEVQELVTASRLDREERSYLLILASTDELPVPEWTIEGLDGTVASDLPLFLSCAPRPGADALTKEQWSEAFTPAFPWILGRVPFTEVARLTAALAPGPGVTRDRPVALLGAERYLVWSDASQVMNRAKGRLRSRGWRANLHAEDWPCDVFLDEDDPAAFLGAWACDSPDVVYLNSHGSSMFGIEVGDLLLSVSLLEEHQRSAPGLQRPSRPRQPALLVIGACRAGDPDAEFTRRLFQDCWVHSIIASSENTEPTPLWPAVRAQLDTAEALAAGLTVGQAMQAIQRSYFDDARGGDPGAIARNLLGMTLYGDPARPVLGGQ